MNQGPSAWLLLEREFFEPVGAFGDPRVGPTPGVLFGGYRVALGQPGGACGVPVVRGAVKVAQPRQRQRVPALACQGQAPSVLAEVAGVGHCVAGGGTGS